MVSLENRIELAQTTFLADCRWNAPFHQSMTWLRAGYETAFTSQDFCLRNSRKEAWSYFRILRLCLFGWKRTRKKKNRDDYLYMGRLEAVPGFGEVCVWERESVCAREWGCTSVGVWEHTCTLRISNVAASSIFPACLYMIIPQLETGSYVCSRCFNPATLLTSQHLCIPWHLAGFLHFLHFSKTILGFLCALLLVLWQFPSSAWCNSFSKHVSVSSHWAHMLLGKLEGTELNGRQQFKENKSYMNISDRYKCVDTNM